MAYTPNPDRAIKGGKAMVSAQELADFREKFGKDQTLRDLLNMDKGLQRKLEIPKSMRKLPATESEINLPIVIPKSMRKLPQNEPDQNIRDRTDGVLRTHNIPSMKRGGAVKKMSSSGSASSRADGCATKGKTKGRFV